MLPETTKRVSAEGSAARVSRHRVRAAANGLQRLEVSVPRADASVVRSVARTLRDGGERAVDLRRTLAAAMPPPVARTGAELWDALRSGPLFDVELDIRRETTDRPAVEFE